MEERHPASERSHSLTETRRTVSSLSGNNIHFKTFSFHHFRKLRYRTGWQYSVYACATSRNSTRYAVWKKLSRFMKERHPASERSLSFTKSHLISGNSSPDYGRLSSITSEASEQFRLASNCHTYTRTHMRTFLELRISVRISSSFLI